MGAWGPHPFDNDDALDWASELKTASDLAPVRSALDATVDSDEPLDADVASRALAACEVIARLKGNNGVMNAYTEAVDEWVRMRPMVPPSDLVRLARDAIAKVLGARSELRELWEESGGDEWQAAVRDLARRVG